MWLLKKIIVLEEIATSNNLPLDDLSRLFQL